jgi:hypothetical protein
MGYLPALGSKAAHFVSDLTTVILNPVSERETSHLPVRHRIPLPSHPPFSRVGDSLAVLNLGLSLALPIRAIRRVRLWYLL